MKTGFEASYLTKKLNLGLAIEATIENNQKAIFLNVNKYNNAIHFYMKQGFTKVKDEVIDIGNGYVMDDYVMEVAI